MGEKILVIAAHPDDEVLGCGGTMARHVEQGDTVQVVILAEGITSRDNKRDRSRREAELIQLHQAVHHAADLIGVKEVTLHDFPDNRMDGIQRLDVIKVVDGYINQIQPDIIYTHHRGDVNVDHGIVHDAVVIACRPIPEKQIPHTLLFFEVQSSTEWQTPGSGTPFVPGWFVDISDTLKLKLEALRAYETEMCPWPHARSIEAIEHLARWRGTNIGVEAAEAFILGRRILK